MMNTKRIDALLNTEARGFYHHNQGILNCALYRIHFYTENKFCQ